MALETQGFAAQRPWRVVLIDSPGAGPRYVESLLASLASLRQLLPTGGAKPLLVCDREAASIVALNLAKFGPHVAGVVLVGAGGIPKSAVTSLGRVPVRLVRLANYPGTAAIDRTLAFVERHNAPLDSPTAGRVDIELLHQRTLPWLHGVPLSLIELETFAASLFDR